MKLRNKEKFVKWLLYVPNFYSLKQQLFVVMTALQTFDFSSMSSPEMVFTSRFQAAQIRSQSSSSRCMFTLTEPQINVVSAPLGNPSRLLGNHFRWLPNEAHPAGIEPVTKREWWWGGWLVCWMYKKLRTFCSVWETGCRKDQVITSLIIPIKWCTIMVGFVSI